MTPEEYFKSLTPQWKELINAINAKDGVYVLYGHGSNGKTQFLKVLDAIREEQNRPLLQSMPVTSINKPNCVFRNVESVISELNEYDKHYIDTVTFPHKLWVHFNGTFERGIHFNNKFTTSNIVTSREFIKSCVEFINDPEEDHEDYSDKDDDDYVYETDDDESDEDFTSSEDE